MRLISHFPSEKEVFAFHTFLLKKGIKSVYELSSEIQDKHKPFRLWVVNEEDIEAAKIYFEEFQNSPYPTELEEMPEKNPQPEKPSLYAPTRLKKPFRPILTFLILAACSLIFLFNQVEESVTFEKQGALLLDVGLTPIQRALLYDYPASAELLREFVEEYSLKNLDDVRKLPEAAQKDFSRIMAIPRWEGILKTSSQDLKKVTLFGKIREGEVWRVVSPAFLHRDFLHILFNMIWVWVLSRQIEERLKSFRMTLFVVIIAAVSSTFQYLISGPFFLGFSGVVVGMAAFIWLRQKIAPWEGYPLRKSTLFFLFIFVLSMLLLETGIFVFNWLSKADTTGSIANTAHIMGAVMGLLLARIPFFSRRPAAL